MIWLDFGQAVLIIGAVFAITKWIDSIIAGLGKPLPSWVKPLIAMAIGIGAVLLVSQTVWAHDQIIQGHALDEMDTWSQILIGVLLGSGANVLDQGIKAVRNIGENDPKQY